MIVGNDFLFVSGVLLLGSILVIGLYLAAEFFKP